jgi:hypothetical protein
MSIPKNLAFSLAVVIYGAVQSRDLLHAWQHSPFDKFGWLAFFLWLLPLCFSKRSPNTLFSSLGLLVIFGGSILSLNFLIYAGFAISVSAILGRGWRQIVWLLCAISWMPVFSYLLSRAWPSYILPARIALSLGGTAFLFLWQKTNWHLTVRSQRTGPNAPLHPQTL